MTSFNDKLSARQKEGKFICIGLDPELRKIRLLGEQTASDFNRKIIEATFDAAAAYKLNLANYLSLYNENGFETLAETVAFIQSETDGKIPVILDAKFGDIAHTNDDYDEWAFHHLRVDALTVNPYAGVANLKPFWEWSKRCIMFFCESSGSGNDIQLLPTHPIEYRGTTSFSHIRSDGTKVRYHVPRDLPEYEKNIILPDTVSEVVAFQSEHFVRPGSKADIWLTAPGDKPDRIARLREIAPSVPFLIPGIGAQGGQVAEAAAAAQGNCLITASRSITYAAIHSANPRTDVFDAAQREAVKYNHQIEQAMTELV